MPAQPIAIKSKLMHPDIFRYQHKTGLASVLIALIIILAAVLGLPRHDTQSLINAIDSDRSEYFSVDRVIDGDTIVIDGPDAPERVRLIGIDTPEKHHPQKPVQCFAQAASDHLSQLIGRQQVRLEPDPTNQDRDRYGRLLRYVYTEDGTFLNAKQIEDGYGFAYLTYPTVHMEEFLRLERAAREAERGLWGECEVNIDNGEIQTRSED